PGVFIPVLFVTPASRSRPARPPPPDLVLRSSRTRSFADFMPYGDALGLWIRLRNPESDSLELSAPAAPAALVLCVPFSDPDCTTPGAVLTTLAAPPPVRAPPPRTAEAPRPDSGSPPAPGRPPRTAPAIPPAEAPRPDSGNPPSAGRGPPTAPA